MEFGIQFFPDVSPAQKPASDYFAESLTLVELCDPYGYTDVRTVEHYVQPYGGDSPDPRLLLTIRSRSSARPEREVIPRFKERGGDRTAA